MFLHKNNNGEMQFKSSWNLRMQSSSLETSDENI